MQPHHFKIWTYGQTHFVCLKTIPYQGKHQNDDAIKWIPSQTIFLLFNNAKSLFLSIEPQMYYCPKFSSCDHPLHRCTKFYLFLVSNEN